MPKNHVVRFVVTRDQKEKILDNARRNGYFTISSYLRNLALNHNLIVEIYDILKNKK